MRRKLALHLGLVCMLIIGINYLATPGHTPRSSSRWHERSGVTMGSTYRWHFELPESIHSQDEQQALINNMLDELQRANKLWSLWDADSELSQFNRAQNTDWFPVDSSTIELIELAKSLHAVDNRFDVTLAAISDLWGLGPRPRAQNTDFSAEAHRAMAIPPTPPDSSTIQACLMHTGLEKVEHRPAPPALRKRDPLVQIDLSALAAGYLADRIASRLIERGCSNLYIEVTGEIVLRGCNPKGRPWRIGIAKPIEGSMEIQRKLELTDCAIATSGNYRHSIRVGDRNFGHILDPTTGQPADSDILSATVIDRSCARADGVATLLMTMPSASALELANQQGWKVLLLARDGKGGISEQCSHAFVLPLRN